MNTTIAVSDRYKKNVPQLDMPPRILLGPGPANVDPRILSAMSVPPVGHLDPTYLQVMDEIQDLLRYVWQTENPMTLAVAGTGTAAMEATMANAIEPDDVVLIGVKGYFGNRLVDMAGRYGAKVCKMTKTWGEAFTLDEIKQGIETHKPKILALVHAETSTGVRQPLEGVAELCQQHDCLLLVDTVTSMGGVPLHIDKWGIDLAYSCSQKGLGSPPGASPFTMSPKAVEKLRNRPQAVPNWYLDMSLLAKYWGSERVYHHTAPINSNYALRESLRIIAEEGLQERWDRHQRNAEMLWSGLSEIGLQCHVDQEIRLPTLTTVRIPDGVDGKAITKKLLNEYNIEIAGGLGELGGKVWRIGLMGYNSRPENVILLVNALKEVLS